MDQRGDAWRIPAIVLAGTAPFALLTITGALVPAVVLVVLVAVAAACWGPYFAMERTLVQRLTPAGSAVAGTLSTGLGPIPVVAVATAGYLLVAITTSMAIGRSSLTITSA
ncbi:hypothetical protein AB0F52_45920 [Amycolatopsis sp. NPDC024027]|uniref:hypothetical protein n=1 Tax=Amycolatopsis sp. NPDC024027 TaxID=3154327 RepID=UPI0033E2E47C